MKALKITAVLVGLIALLCLLLGLKQQEQHENVGEPTMEQNLPDSSYLRFNENEMEDDDMMWIQYNPDTKTISVKIGKNVTLDSAATMFFDYLMGKYGVKK